MSEAGELEKERLKLERLRTQIAALAIAAPIVTVLISAGFNYSQNQSRSELDKLKLANQFEISLIKTITGAKNPVEVLKVGDALYVEHGDIHSALWWCDVVKAYTYASPSCNKVAHKLTVANNKKWYKAKN